MCKVLGCYWNSLAIRDYRSTAQILHTAVDRMLASSARKGLDAEYVSLLPDRLERPAASTKLARPPGQMVQVAFVRRRRPVDHGSWLSQPNHTVFRGFVSGFEDGLRGNDATKELGSPAWTAADTTGPVLSVTSGW